MKALHRDGQLLWWAQDFGSGRVSETMTPGDAANLIRWLLDSAKAEGSERLLA